MGTFSELEVRAAGQHQREKRASGDCKPPNQLHGHLPSLPPGLVPIFTWQGLTLVFALKPPFGGFEANYRGTPNGAASPMSPLQHVR